MPSQIREFLGAYFSLRIFKRLSPRTLSNTQRNNFTSFAANKPHVLSQAYVLPMTPTSIGVTQTKAGITTREILFGLSSGQLYGINKRLLDPRRPTGKPTSDDKEEGLIPYTPSLDFNPKASASQYETVRLFILFNNPVLAFTLLTHKRWLESKPLPVLQPY